MAEPKRDSDSSAPAIDAALADLRARIDAVDRELLDRLNERARLVQEVGHVKHDGGASVYEPSRERHIVERLADANAGPFPNEGLAPVFREIISATRSLEDPVEVAYLGPAGTFTHQAALEKFGELARLAPAGSITDVFASVEGRKVALGIVPVENTTEGVVTQTLDSLAEFDVIVCAEAVLRISEHLLSRSGNREDVERVASHPQGLAQCRRWLDRHLPDAERVEMPSTAAAARLAAEDGGVAAIASEAAGQAYGLATIEASIEDRRENSTRFLVIGKTESVPSGNDLTLAVFTIRKDEAGALHRLIEPMARHGVSIQSINLRPIAGKPWEYLFFLDLEGHRQEAHVAEALGEASSVAHSARVLGSFPRAGTERAKGDR